MSESLFKSPFGNSLPNQDIIRLPAPRLFNYHGTHKKAMTKLSEAQVERALKSLPGWRREGEFITKEFHFQTFMAGIRFVDKVALIAEAQEHHPDIHVVWTTVTLKIQTHDEGGITEWDVGLAGEIEKRLSRAKKPAR